MSAFSGLFRQAVAALIVLLCLAVPAPAEDDNARAERFDGLIEGLNSSSTGRARVLESIYSELRGPDGTEMQRVLREALSRPNTLILQGAVEGMAMLGDTRDVANLDILLATTDKMEVKAVVLRLLPAFCLATERARFAYIDYASGYQTSPNPAVLEPLRRPPLTRRGRLDATLERLQGRVIRSIAAQFDPVGAALPHLEDVRYGPAARTAIAHYVGDSLGNDPSRWSRIWAAQGRDTEYRVPGEIEEIRLAALTSLSDMGAEGLPEVLAAFDLLFETGDATQRQAAFETMAVMCRVGFAGYPALAAMTIESDEAVEAENWRRRIESNVNLAVYTAAGATKTLHESMHGDAGVFVAAAGALGAALSFPRDYPDGDGRLLASRADGVGMLERLMLYPDIDREKRASVVAAMASVGAPESVVALTSLVNSPYTTADFGNDGTLMAEAVVDALRDIAVGGQDGRADARRALLMLLEDERQFPPVRPGTPPVGMAHMVLWRLQRLARSNDISFRPGDWRERLGW
ncbi:MAG: hypothetical protein LUE17_00455 [Planctomycetaceae bacterium]|nr:hypothetical protein [Planctomycetaceae bacterium]